MTIWTDSRITTQCLFLQVTLCRLAPFAESVCVRELSRDDRVPEPKQRNSSSANRVSVLVHFILYNLYTYLQL